MAWVHDDAKLDRVRTLMGERELDALVARAPDNVLYLTNFWGMKGYDAVVFPREGEPRLVLPRGLGRRRGANRVDGGRARVRGYRARSTPAARPHAGARGRRRTPVRTCGRRAVPRTQASDRMVGEPTTFTKAWFDAFPDAGRRDAAAGGRPRGQDRAGDRAHPHRQCDRGRSRWSTCSGVMRAGMTEAQTAAEWLGFVHGEGTGLGREGRARPRLLACLVGSRDQDVHSDDEPAGGRGGADAVRDLGLRGRLLVRSHEEPRAR